MFEQLKVISLKDHTTNRNLYRVVLASKLPATEIDSFLRYLEALGKAPNTIKSYAHDLVLFFRHLEHHTIDWKKMSELQWLEFLHILKVQRQDGILMHPNNQAARSSRTISRLVSAVEKFFQYHYQNGVRPPCLVTEGSNKLKLSPYKSFLSFASKSKSSVGQQNEPKLPKAKGIQSPPPMSAILDAEQQKDMLSACLNRRDQLLILLLLETGLRIGQALGLKHEDIESWSNTLNIRPRLDNPNLAYAKRNNELQVYVSDDWLDLYADILVHEMSDIESEFIFTNLYNRRNHNTSNPLRYSTVRKLFERISLELGFKITAHMLRHTHATELLRAGVSIDMVAKRLGHHSIETTKSIYEHLTVRDMKMELQRCVETNSFLKGIYQQITEVTR